MSDKFWVIHPLRRDLGEHAPAWDALRRRLHGPNPMQSSGFVNHLLEQFGSGKEYLAVLQHGLEPSAMCVLQPDGRWKWKSFLPSQTQIGPTLVPNPEDVQKLIHALPGHVIELDLLCNDTDFGTLAERAFTETHSIDHNLTMHIDLTGNFADYWASRPKKLVQNMGRYARRMEADGMSPRMESISVPEEIISAVKRYAALEIQGWKGQEGTALGNSSEQQRFYERVMACHAEHGNAMAWELWFGARLVASRLAIREDHTVVMLKTTFSESDAAYSPGRELLRRVVERCFEALPGGRIEFYTDASADQLQWASGHRWIRHVSFYRNFAARMAVAAVRFAPASEAKGAGVLLKAEDIGIKVYRHPNDFPSPLQDLFNEAETVSMQFGVDWYRNLVDQVFSSHTGVKFYVMEHRGRPVAVLPLLATRTLMGWRAQSLGNYYTALYAPQLAVGLRGRDLARLFKAVLKDHPGLSEIQLSPLATEASSFRSIQRGLNVAGLACFPYFCFGNWFMPVGEDSTRYLAGRSSQVRNTVARMGRKLAAAGGYLEIVENHDIERGLCAYEQVYAVSWKQPEPHPGFVPGLIRLCAARGWLRLGVAWLGEEPIAAQIWIVAHGKADIYKLAYDERFKAFSPGTLLTAMLMKHVIDVDKVAEVDYLVGDDPYKESWMSTRRERWGLKIYNPRTARGLGLLGLEVLGRMAKAVRAEMISLGASWPFGASPTRAPGKLPRETKTAAGR